jgi:hypothetical protein
MKIHSKDFRVPQHKKIDIKRLPTMVKPFCESKKEYKDLLEEHIAELTSLQQLHLLAAASSFVAICLLNRDFGIGANFPTTLMILEPPGCFGVRPTQRPISGKNYQTNSRAPDPAERTLPVWVEGS